MSRIACPFEKYPEAWVEVPDEWLGQHLLKHDEAIRATAALNDVWITRAAVSLSIAEDWGGIPGIEGKDPAKWDFSKTPIALMSWLEAAVYTDFARCFIVPKGLSKSSPETLSPTAN